MTQPYYLGGPLVKNDSLDSEVRQLIGEYVNSATFPHMSCGGVKFASEGVH